MTWLATALAVVALALTACGGGDEDAGSRTFVGGAGEGLIGLAEVDGRLVAYLCNSRDRSSWFEGDRTEDEVELISRSGAELAAEIEGTEVTGTVSVDGEELEFTAAEVSAPAGLYRSETVLGEPGARARRGVLAGWIVRGDGRQEGAVEVVADPPPGFGADPATPAPAGEPAPVEGEPAEVPAPPPAPDPVAADAGVNTAGSSPGGPVVSAEPKVVEADGTVARAKSPGPAAPANGISKALEKLDEDAEDEDEDSESDRKTTAPGGLGLTDAQLALIAGNGRRLDDAVALDLSAGSDADEFFAAAGLTRDEVRDARRERQEAADKVPIDPALLDAELRIVFGLAPFGGSETVRLALEAFKEEIAGEESEVAASFDPSGLSAGSLKLGDAVDDLDEQVLPDLGARGLLTSVSGAAAAADLAKVSAALQGGAPGTIRAAPPIAPNLSLANTVVLPGIGSLVLGRVGGLDQGGDFDEVIEKLFADADDVDVDLVTGAVTDPETGEPLAECGLDEQGNVIETGELCTVATGRGPVLVPEEVDRDDLEGLPTADPDTGEPLPPCELDAEGNLVDRGQLCELDLDGGEEPDDGITPGPGGGDPGLTPIRDPGETALEAAARTIRNEQRVAVLRQQIVEALYARAGLASPAPDAGVDACAGASVIEVANGRPRGGIETLEFTQGDRVRFVVRSTTAEQIHVHGYDEYAQVAAGGSVCLDFNATEAGRFQVALHNPHGPIARLEVER